MTETESTEEEQNWTETQFSSSTGTLQPIKEGLESNDWKYLFSREPISAILKTVSLRNGEERKVVIDPIMEVSLPPGKDFLIPTLRIMFLIVKYLILLMMKSFHPQ